MGIPSTHCIRYREKSFAACYKDAEFNVYYVDYLKKIDNSPSIPVTHFDQGFVKSSSMFDNVAIFKQHQITMDPQ